MCPDRKLKWFKDHGRTPRQIKEIEKKVVSVWNTKYAPEGSANLPSTNLRVRAFQSLCSYD